MQKLETINTKQIVTESVETKKVITESVARRVVKESADPVFTSSIARGLVEEFGYELVSEVAFSPEQQAKMGQANPQDPYIVARVLGKDAVPLSHFTDPEDQAIAKRIGFKDGPAAPATGAAANPMQKDPAQQAAGAAATKPTGFVKPPPGVIFNEPPAAAPTGTTAQGDEAGNTMITKPDGTVQVVGPDGNVIPPGGGKETPSGGAATKPAAADPAVAATREKFKALMDKLEKSGGVSGSAPAPAATATKPAATATKPAEPVSGAQSAGQSVGGAIKSGAKAVGDFAKGAYQGITKESVSFEDDKTLLAIKNIRY